MAAWNLKCLLCGHTSTDLVAIQEHAMTEHGYTQEDHRKSIRITPMDANPLLFQFPDGKVWLEARRIKTQ